MKGKAMSGPWGTEWVYYGDSTRICAATLYGPSGSFASVENGSKWYYDEKRQANKDFKATVQLLRMAPEFLRVLKAVRWYLDEPNDITVDRAKDLLDEAIAAVS